METKPNQPENTQTTQTTQTTQPAQTFATYTDYTNARLSCTPSEQKTIPGTGPQANPPSAPQYYYQIPLMYNFGTPENRILNDFLFEGCEMDTQFGIQSKPGQSGRLEHSVMCRFDANNAEHNRFIESMNQLHGGCAFILQQMKGAVKLYNFNAQMAEATGLKNPIYRARDEVTGEVVQGRAPSMFLKLFSRGKPPMTEETLFTGLDGKPIPWALMRNVEMKFIPLIHIKRLYVGGGKASIQMEVVSAVVTSIRARNSTTRQLTTIHRLQQARPELPDMVAAQLAKLTIDRQDQMLGGAVPPPPPDQQGAPENQPTFAGIVPTRQMAQPAPATQYQMAQITATHQTTGAATLPTIPALGGTQPTMQDFTATAPVRAPVIPAAVVPNMNQKTPSPGTGTVPPGTPLQLN
jgi:hypothetical protein